MVTGACSGFVYAASLMGVTGARTTLSNAASELVSRLRRVTNLPIAVGLGVSNPAQASEVAHYADGVIVGSAFIKLVLESSNLEEAIPKVRELAEQLSAGVRTL
jgi:tryptophan synthase alpha chain